MDGRRRQGEPGDHVRPAREPRDLRDLVHGQLRPPAPACPCRVARARAAAPRLAVGTAGNGLRRHDDQRHDRVLAHGLPGRRRQLQRRDAGPADRRRGEGGPGDHVRPAARQDLRRPALHRERDGLVGPRRVALRPPGNCTVSGSTVTLTGAGSCTLTASQAGNGELTMPRPPSRSRSRSPQRPATLTLVANPARAEPAGAVQRHDRPRGDGSGWFDGQRHVHLRRALSRIGDRRRERYGQCRRCPQRDQREERCGRLRRDSSLHAVGGQPVRRCVRERHGRGQQGGAGRRRASRRLCPRRLHGDADRPAGHGPSLSATLLQGLAPEAGDTGFVDYSKVTVNAMFTLYPAGCTSTGCPTAPAWTSASLRVANAASWATDGRGTVSVTGPKTLARAHTSSSSGRRATRYILPLVRHVDADRRRDHRDLHQRRRDCDRRTRRRTPGTGPAPSASTSERQQRAVRQRDLHLPDAASTSRQPPRLVDRARRLPAPATTSTSSSAARRSGTSSPASPPPTR